MEPSSLLLPSFHLLFSRQLLRVREKKEVISGERERNEPGATLRRHLVWPDWALLQRPLRSVRTPICSKGGGKEEVGVSEAAYRRGFLRPFLFSFANHYFSCAGKEGGGGGGSSLCPGKAAAELSFLLPHAVQCAPEEASILIRHTS